ncbi:hypothetical protein, conserved [Babesia ovata]|uniref:Uncharacterized protein n=1 Tax=Babesia ovata TaxID=189622 RepID=A0A2H6KCL7_9APIC|nr:uncharacterized protein BOVATA_022310 [Babesia ovata]GBE60738.1 hypothetical protein, conserved [Babesia ovata]
MHKSNKARRPKRKDGSKDVASTAADSWSQSAEAELRNDDATECAAIPYELVEFKLRAASKVVLLYGRTGKWAALARKAELVDDRTLRNILSLKLPKYEHRGLEMACLMLKVVKERTTREEYGNYADDDTVSDVSVETFAAIEPEEMMYQQWRPGVAEIVALCAIWAIEVARGSNLAIMAYRVLILMSNFHCNKYIRRYVATLFDDDTPVIDIELMHKLTLLQHVCMTPDSNLDKDKLLRICFATAKRDDSNIYVDDVVTRILSQIWSTHKCRLEDLPSRCRYRLMGQLLYRGLEQEKIAPALVKAAVSGPYHERKLALAALKETYDKVDTNIVTEAANEVLQTPDSVDLGILGLAAVFLEDQRAAFSYLQELCKQIANKVGMADGSIEEMCADAKNSVIHLVTDGGAIPEATRRHVRKTGKHFFTVRDLLNAISATFSRIWMIVTEKSAKEKIPQESPMGTTVDTIALIAICLATLRQELVPYVMDMIDMVMHLTGTPKKTLRFCTRTLKRCKKPGEFWDKLTVVTSQLVRTMMQPVIVEAYTPIMEERCVLAPFVKEIADAMHAVVDTAGQSLVRYSCATSVSETVAQLAAYLSVITPSQYSAKVARRICNTLETVLEHLLQPIRRKKGDENRADRVELEDILHYRGDAFEYIAQGFETICCVTVPKLEMIGMMLSLVWHPDIAKRVFRGFETLVLTMPIGADVRKGLLMYCFRREVHTDWDVETLDTLHAFIFGLFAISIRNNKRKNALQDKLKVTCRNGINWKARRKLAGPWRHGVVRLDRGNNIAYFLEKFMKLVEVEAKNTPVAIRQPIRLLDENLGMIATRPVSRESLAAVPWVGVSRITTLIEEVHRRGPNDAKTWSQLLKRFDVILNSFGHKHLARVLVTLAKVGNCPDDLLRKIRNQALSQLQQCDLLSCCGILYGMKRLGACDTELLQRFRKQVVDTVSTAQAPYPVVMLIHTFADSGDKDTTLVLLKEVVKRADQLSPKALAMVLVAATANYGQCKEVEAAMLQLLLTAAGRMGEMDLRSLTQLYSSIAKSGFAIREHILDAIADEIVPHVERLTPQQAVLVLSGAARAKHAHPQLAAAVVNALERKTIDSDPQLMVFLLSAIVKLNLQHSSLATQLQRALGKTELRPTEFANLVYLVGKWRLPQPSMKWLSSQLDRLLQSSQDMISLRDAALIAYGFAASGEMDGLAKAVGIAEDIAVQSQEQHDQRTLAMINHAAQKLRLQFPDLSTNSRSPE